VRNVVVIPNINNYGVGGFAGGMSFDVDANGNVTSTNSVAAQGSGNRLIFNTTTINVDPVNYTGQWHMHAFGGFAGSAPQSFVVVPGMDNYLVQPKGARFRYNVDDNGNVISQNPNSGIGVGNTLFFNNATINIDPGDFEGQYFHGFTSPQIDTPQGFQTFVVVPGEHLEIQIPNGGSFMRFAVDTSGNVTSMSPGAAVGIGNTLSFKNSKLRIDPNDHVGTWGFPYIPSVSGGSDNYSGAQEFVVIPSLSYIVGPSGSPTLSAFAIGADCQPRPSSLPFTVGGQTVTFLLSCVDCDPIGWWQAEGNALDSAIGNDGQLHAGATFSDGQIGQAFSLDGMDDLVRIGEDSANLDGFSVLTLAAWINPDNFDHDPPEFGGGTDANGIVTKYDSRQANGVSYSLSIREDGFLQFAVYHGVPGSEIASIYTDQPVVSVDEWTHVAGVWRGGLDFSLFVNGTEVLASILPGSTPIAVINDNTTPVNIGRFESAGGSWVGPFGFFDGLIDDVRIYNCGLGANEIESIYLEGAMQSSIISGRVFDDRDNDGLYEPFDDDFGIEGVMVTLTGSDHLGPVNRSTVTSSDGSYAFTDVFAGTYTLTEVQPSDRLDGKETAGNLGGDVDNTQDSNTITSIVIGNDGVDAAGYNVAEIRPSELQGLVWQDFNNDGEVNFGEKAIENVTIAISGTDDRGDAVNLSAATDVDGVYMFVELRPGVYTLTETQPAGFDDGPDIIGMVNGSPGGTNPVNDVLAEIDMPLPGSVAENYNFAERPPTGGGVISGQTATIGFWQNNNGQALIESLNGGSNSTQLGNWLAATFVNTYGTHAGANDLSGMTNGQVADFYSDLFRRKKKEAVELGLGGPVKMDAQVMAVALATYVTNQTLAGSTATSFGFQVTENGVGTSTFNVGGSGEAFNVADHTVMAVLDLLFATNQNSRDGVLYDMDGDGDADDNWETTLRTLANDVYSAINESGGI
jgi:hypothetical protein